jgi:hypothetical protein
MTNYLIRYFHHFKAYLMDISLPSPYLPTSCPPARPPSCPPALPPPAWRFSLHVQAEVALGEGADGHSKEGWPEGRAAGQRRGLGRRNRLHTAAQCRAARGWSDASLPPSLLTLFLPPFRPPSLPLARPPSSPARRELR